VTPAAINKAIFKKQEKNMGVTELVEIDGASNGLTIDGTWRKSCDTALDFVKRLV
jgi:hypothetical protein